MITETQIVQHLSTINPFFTTLNITHYEILTHDPSGNILVVHLEHSTHPDVLDITINLAYPFLT